MEPHSSKLTLSPGPNSSHHLTVVHGRKRECFNLEKPVIDFQVVCASPYARDIQEPSCVIVLLGDDMVGIDLSTPNFSLHPAPYGEVNNISVNFSIVSAS